MTRLHPKGTSIAYSAQGAGATAPTAALSRREQAQGKGLPFVEMIGDVWL